VRVLAAPGTNKFRPGDPVPVRIQALEITVLGVFVLENSGVLLAVAFGEILLDPQRQLLDALEVERVAGCGAEQSHVKIIAIR